MYSIHVEKSTAHAVSPVRKTRLLYFDRRRGVWLQNRSWDAAQAGRHALDRQGRQRHHRPALQQAQRTLPGFLGTPLRAKAGGCMTSLNLMCARDGRLPSALSFPRLLAPVHPEAEPKGAAFLCAFRNVPCSSSWNASRNCSCVFLTIGPYHASGPVLPQNFPHTTRTCVPSSSVISGISTAFTSW